MYKIPDLQYFKLSSINVGHQFDIELPYNTLKYKIEEMDGYFLFNCNDPERNSEIFEILGITSPVCFIRKVVNHKMFPEIQNKEDLLKVIVALDKECIKKFGDKNMQNEFKDGDYISVKRNGDLCHIMIFKKFVRDEIYRYANYCCSTGNLYLNEDGYITKANSVIEHATKEESKILDDELLKKGLIWNPTCKILVPISTTPIDSSETKPIFKVGDVVRIKPRIKNANEYIPIYTTAMAKYAEKIATVVNISPLGSVQLDIDSSACYWAPEILEKTTKDEIAVINTNINTGQNVVSISAPTALKQTESEKINLFPTKRHYKFNFSIN